MCGFLVVDRLQSISVAWKLRIELVPSCEVEWYFDGFASQHCVAIGVSAMVC
jgi:hypothetical protein